MGKLEVLGRVKGDLAVVRFLGGSSETTVRAIKQAFLDVVIDQGEYAEAPDDSSEVDALGQSVSQAGNVAIIMDGQGVIEDGGIVNWED